MKKLEKQRNIWKAQSKNDPLIFRPFLKVFRSSWILACGLSFTRYTLFWFFFRWFALRFREIMYFAPQYQMVFCTTRSLMKFYSVLNLWIILADYPQLSLSIRRTVIMLCLQLYKKIWSVHAFAFVIGRYSSFAFVLMCRCTCACTSADYPLVGDWPQWIALSTVRTTGSRAQLFKEDNTIQWINHYLVD